MNDVATNPVFVDGTGRRSRRVSRLAYIATSACTVYMVVVGASLAAGQRTPMLELPFAAPPAAAPAEMPTFLQAAPVLGVPGAGGTVTRGVSAGRIVQVVDLAAFVAPATAAAPARVAAVTAPAPAATAPVIPAAPAAPVTTPPTTPPAVPPTVPPVVDGPDGSEGGPDPVTPDPGTPDPVTPDPVTPDPVTPDPVVPDPVVPDPEPAPVTPTPTEPAPAPEPAPLVGLAPLVQAVDGLL